MFYSASCPIFNAFFNKAHRRSGQFGGEVCSTVSPSGKHQKFWWSFLTTNRGTETWVTRSGTKIDGTITSKRLLLPSSRLGRIFFLRKLRTQFQKHGIIMLKNTLSLSRLWKPQTSDTVTCLNLSLSIFPLSRFLLFICFAVFSFLPVS